jgi:RNA polymerase sigma-70 factor (ECF subfamily)
MMAQEPSFSNLCEQLRRGDNAAAAEVFDRFAGRLIALARSRLDRRLRQRVDAEDVLQSVLRTFFVHVAEGKFRLPNWDSLWGLLVCITVRKCTRAHDRHRAGLRDVRREAGPAPDGWDSADTWEVISREPGPEEAILLQETLDGALLGMTERERQAVFLTLQGLATAEVATRLDCSQRKVYRVLEHVRNRLQRHGGQENP